MDVIQLALTWFGWPNGEKLALTCVKPWPNGVASRRRLKTWVYLRLRLARPCVYLRWLALTLVEVKFARKPMQRFHRLATQPKSTQVEWRPFYLLLSPGQTESQVDANWKLGSTCDTVWPGLACTCVDLRWLTLTLIEIKFARKSKQVFHRLATQPAPNQSQRKLSDIH